MTICTTRLHPPTIVEAVRGQWRGQPEFLPSPDRGRIGQGRCPFLGRIFHKILWRKDLAPVAGQEVHCKDTISADDPVGLIEPEAERVSAMNDRAVREGKSHHECCESPTDSPETPGGLGDCDSVVVEGYPGALIDLDTGLNRIPQPMDL